MKKLSSFPYGTNDAILIVNSYTAGNIDGVILHPRLASPQTVGSIPQLLFLLDELHREQGLPIVPHAFKPDKNSYPDHIATLRIRILFSENYTWQGTLGWEEERMEAPFRSVLELIQLIDEILSN